jgi:hypothetical protein
MSNDQLFDIREWFIDGAHIKIMTNMQFIMTGADKAEAE